LSISYCKIIANHGKKKDCNFCPNFAEQGEWLDRHFPHGVKAEDRRGNIMLPLNIDSMEDIGVNKRQSSQSRLIAKEPEHKTKQDEPKLIHPEIHSTQCQTKSNVTFTTNVTFHRKHPYSKTLSKVEQAQLRICWFMFWGFALPPISTYNFIRIGRLFALCFAIAFGLKFVLLL
jgi:hypothetical protein